MAPDRPADAGRRRALRAALAVTAATGIVPRVASAQPAAWPAKPVRVIVPYAAGGVVDVMTRAVTQRMSTDLGQPFVVEPKPGANANIAADTVANAPADGYTLLVSASFLINNPLIETGLRWKPSDFLPVARFALSPSFLCVPADSPAKTAREWIELARRTPGMLYGDGGTGTPQSMAIEMMKTVAGLKLEPVAYKGAPPIVPDLIAGTVSMSVLPSTVAIPQVKAGKLRALANTADKRSPLLPDVPTFAEAGLAEATVLSWYGFHVPAGTPPDVIRRIGEATVAAAAQAEVRDRLVSAGGEAAPIAGAEFLAFLRDEQVRWTRFAEVAKRGAPR